MSDNSKGARGASETDGPARSGIALLCFDLHAASRAMTAVYRPLLDEIGLTYTQYLVMLLLWEDEPRGIKDVGRVLELDSGTISPLIKRLEAAGMVRRDRRTADEREVEVALTPGGRALRERARHIPRAIERASNLSGAETEDLRGRIAELRTALRRESTR